MYDQFDCRFFQSQSLVVDAVSLRYSGIVLHWCWDFELLQRIASASLLSLLSAFSWKFPVLFSIHFRCGTSYTDTVLTSHLKVIFLRTNLFRLSMIVLLESCASEHYSERTADLRSLLSPKTAANLFPSTYVVITASQPRELFLLRKPRHLTESSPLVFFSPPPPPPYRYFTPPFPI